MLSMNKIDKNAPNFMWKRQDVSLWKHFYKYILYGRLFS
jgi:hypothetical protein